MTIQLIKIEKEGTSNWYGVKVDGSLVLHSDTGNLEEAQTLYNQIVADPSILVSREIILQSQTI